VPSAAGEEKKREGRSLHRKGNTSARVMLQRGKGKLILEGRETHPLICQEGREGGVETRDWWSRCPVERKVFQRATRPREEKLGIVKGKKERRKGEKKGRRPRSKAISREKRRH